MKKYIAIIMSLMMVGCAFTACGDSKDSGDEEKTKASAAENDNDDEEKPAKDKGKNKLSKVYGKWQPEENKAAYLNIEDEDTAWLVVDQDLSKDICFDENKNLVFKGKAFGEDDYKFKNGKFVLEYEGENVLTMKKTDDSDDIFGEYKWENCSSYDAFTKGFSNKAGGEEVDIDVFMTCEENKTIFSCHIPVDEFKLDSDTITLKASLFKEKFLESEYEVDGDELILISDDGKTKKFIRLD